MSPTKNTNGLHSILQQIFVTVVHNTNQTCFPGLILDTELFHFVITFEISNVIIPSNSQVTTTTIQFTDDTPPN